MVKRVTLFLAILLTATWAKAQNEWTLERCIGYALENNIQVKQQELNVEQQSNNLLRSKLSLLPSISSSGSYSFNWGRFFDQNSINWLDTRAESSSASIGASLSLFSGLQKQNTIKKGELDVQIANKNIEKLKNDISLNVAAAYLQILLDEENLEIAKQQLETTKQQLSKTKILVEAGSTTMSTYLELQAQEATEEVQLVTAESKLALSYLSLRQLLDLQGEQSFKIVNPNIAEPPTARTTQRVEDIFEQNAPARPEVAGAELQLKSAEKSLSIAKGALYPSLSLGGGSGTSFSSAITAQNFWEQYKGNMSYYASVSLSIPIFNGWQTRTNVRNAKLAVRSAELEVQSVKNTLYKEIQQAETDAEAALRRYNASLKNVDALQESFRYTDQKFNIGMVSTTDYNLAKNNLTKAQSELVQAKYQYVFQTKILDFYKGLPLSL